MKIVDLRIEKIQAPLIIPFKTALRSVVEIDNVLVKIITDTGNIGLGEAAPTAAITGETKASIIYAIENLIKPKIIGIDIYEMDLLNKIIEKSIIKNTSAKAAVSIAIYDLYAQWLKKPLYKVLGGGQNEISTDITISLNEVDRMVRDSVDAIKRGFNILKIKVGNDYIKDIERVKEIRKAVGKDRTLRVDANQGWSVKESIKIINKLEELDLDIELVEQPVPYYDLKGLKKITESTSVKILADESVFTVKDAITIIDEGIADVINIKLMKCGGVYNALNIINVAESYNVQCMMGCMLESKVSVTAAAHIAGAKSNITMVDLDGPNLCSKDAIKGGAEFNKNIIKLSGEIGLGF